MAASKTHPKAMPKHAHMRKDGFPVNPSVLLHPY